MEKVIIIRAEADETLVAVMENRRLVELYIDRADEERLTGNIYKGVVENVLPGMQAAFVDIGLHKNSFLYIREVLPKMAAEDEDLDRVNINDLLKKGQEILQKMEKTLNDLAVMVGYIIICINSDAAAGNDVGIISFFLNDACMDGSCKFTHSIIIT